MMGEGRRVREQGETRQKEGKLGGVVREGWRGGGGGKGVGGEWGGKGKEGRPRKHMSRVMQKGSGS